MTGKGKGKQGGPDKHQICKKRDGKGQPVKTPAMSDVWNCQWCLRPQARKAGLATEVVLHPKSIGPLGKAGSGIRTLAPRTCKADVVVGLPKGRDEELKEGAVEVEWQVRRRPVLRWPGSGRYLVGGIVYV